ncbi:hypothetical protein KAS14_05265 [Candidatus Bathyarchaeota archaeon]|nr:hypothetical protein [Candidatus Bathyarchaeota archaeon]
MVWKYVSRFLIFFGLLGFLVCPVAIYFASSHMSVFSIWIDEASTHIGEIKGMINETSIGVQLIRSLVSDSESMIGNVSTKLPETILILVSANETTFRVLNQANETLNEVTDVLDVISENLQIQFLAPEVVAEAEEAAGSIRSTQDNLSDIIFSLNNTVSSIESLTGDIVDRLETIKDLMPDILITINTLDSCLQTASTSIEAWNARLQVIKESFWVIEYSIYGIIG